MNGLFTKFSDSVPSVDSKSCFYRMVRNSQKLSLSDESVTDITIEERGRETGYLHQPPTAWLRLCLVGNAEVPDGRVASSLPFTAPEHGIQLSV